MTTNSSRLLLVFAAVGGLVIAAPSRAGDDPISDLANAICGASNLNAITSALATLAPENALNSEEVAEAFGVATFLGDLGRCVNRQAIADGFAFFKKGKDAARLDAAFAMGRVAAKPGGGAAGADSYQGSFAVLGTAGEPPSGQ